MASAALSARLGSGAETSDLGKAEREAMEKSSLIYVRNASASSANAQALNSSMTQCRNWDWAWPPARACVPAWNQRPALLYGHQSWR